MQYSRKVSLELDSSHISNAIKEYVDRLTPGYFKKDEEVCIVEFKKQWPPTGKMPMEFTMRKIKEVRPIERNGKGTGL